MTGLAAPAVHCDTCHGTGEVSVSIAAPGLGALLTTRECPEPVHRRLVLGDVVRVRDEDWLSVIDQPTDGPPTCDPATLPEMDGACCVPVALVRPYGDPAGPARWVQQSDLTRTDPDG